MKNVINIWLFLSKASLNHRSHFLKNKKKIGKNSRIHFEVKKFHFLSVLLLIYPLRIQLPIKIQGWNLHLMQTQNKILVEGNTIQATC